MHGHLPPIHALRCCRLLLRCRLLCRLLLLRRLLLRGGVLAVPLRNQVVDDLQQSDGSSRSGKSTPCIL